MTRSPSRPAADARRPSSRPPVNIDPIRVLREHWKAIAAGGVVGAVLGTILNYGMGAVYPIYSGEAVFEIRNRIIEGTDAVGQDYSQEEQVVRIANTEIGFMLSDRVLEAVMAAPAFRATEYAKQFIDNDVLNTNDCLRELKSDLSASFARSSQLFVLRMSWTIREDIATILNTVGQTYMTLRVADENNRITSGTDSMRKRVKEIEAELSSIDDQIKKELRDAKIQSYDEDPQKGQRALEALLLRRADVIQQVQLTQSRLESAKARQGGTGLGTEEELREARRDSAVQALLVDRDRVQGNYDAVRARYRDGTPQEKEAREALEKVEQQLKTRLAEQVQQNRFADEKRFDEDLSALRETLKGIDREIAETEAVLVDRAQVVTGIERLKQVKQGKQEERQALEQTIASNQLRADRADAQQIIMRAAVDPRERSFPKLKITLPGGAALGVLAVVGVLFLREITEQRVRYPADLIGAGKILGVIPQRQDEAGGPTQPEWALWNHPNASFSEVMRQFSMEVSRAWGTPGGGPPAKGVMFVSAGPSAGTTTMVTNFAAAAAHAARKVLIIDCNFRRPRMHELVGLPSETPGLGELLQGRITPEQAIRPAVPGIDVVCAGGAASRLPELLCTLHTVEVIEHLKANYDVVVMDAPPLVVAGESLLLADRVGDRVVLVVNALTQEKGLVFRYANKLREAGAEVIGLVLNRPVEVQGGHLQRNLRTIAAYGSGSPAAQPSPTEATG
jgi:Mrp family chromosome partitioning ATPase